MRELYGLKITLANFCGYKCKYCFVQTDDKSQLDFSLFQKLVQYYTFQKLSQKRFFFLGGEVLLCFELFSQCVSYIRHIQESRDFSVYLVISGLGMTEEKAIFLSQNKVNIGISIDGVKEIHDLNRVDKLGRGSYDRTREAIDILNRFYDDTNLGYTITVDQQTTKYLFKNFLFLASLDVKRRNVGIAAVCKERWTKMELVFFGKQLKKICNFITEKITQNDFYYYNILGFFIIELLDRKEPKDGNLEIHVFPDGKVSQFLFSESKWEEKNFDPNYIRFGVVIPFAKNIIQLSETHPYYKQYINSLYKKAIF